jgi:hypothetical protein
MRLLFIASTFLFFKVGAQSLAKLGPLPSIEALKEGELETSIKRGVDYLVSKQNKDGSWGGPTRTKGLNIYAPVPDSHLAFRTGASTLALSGLLDSKDRRPEVVTAIDKAEAWLFEKLPKLRHLDPTTTYNVWGHAYGLRAIADLYVYRTGDETKLSLLKQLAAKQIEMLIKTEDVNGGWGYPRFRQPYRPFLRHPNFVYYGNRSAWHERCARNFWPFDSRKRNQTWPCFNQQATNTGLVICLLLRSPLSSKIRNQSSRRFTGTLAGLYGCNAEIRG